MYVDLLSVVSLYLYINKTLMISNTTITCIENFLWNQRDPSVSIMCLTVLAEWMDGSVLRLPKMIRYFILQRLSHAVFLKFEIGNVYNSRELPMVPFRTGNW